MINDTDLEYYLTSKLYVGCAYSKNCIECPFVNMYCELDHNLKRLWKRKELIRKAFALLDIGNTKDQVSESLNVPKSSLVYWINNRNKISNKLSYLEKHLLQPELV